MKAIFNELSDEIDEAKSLINDRGMQKEDKNLIEEKATHRKLLCSAIQVVTDIALHRLGTMNAGELFLASKHRMASREHDRVYGIMGAIGINIARCYDDDASEVMDRFLLKLHQEKPVEIQAFFRDGLSLPDARHWLMDETAQLLTLLRQHKPPTPPAFTGITDDGRLLLDKMEYLKTNGLAELKGAIHPGSESKSNQSVTSLKMQLFSCSAASYFSSGDQISIKRYSTCDLNVSSPRSWWKRHATLHWRSALRLGPSLNLRRHACHTWKRNRLTPRHHIIPSGHAGEKLALLISRLLVRRSLRLLRLPEWGWESIRIMHVGHLERVRKRSRREGWVLGCQTGGWSLCRRFSFIRGPVGFLL